MQSCAIKYVAHAFFCLQAITEQAARGFLHYASSNPLAPPSIHRFAIFHNELSYSGRKKPKWPMRATPISSGAMRQYSIGASTYNPCSERTPSADIISSSVKETDVIGILIDAY